MEATNNRRVRLVVFDVEGVLIPKNRFLFEVGRSLGFLSLLKILVAGFFYEIGITTLKAALRRAYSIMQGTKSETIMKIFDGIPLAPNLKEVFEQLKARNYKTALLSSGLPSFVVEELANKLGADFAFGIRVGANNDVLTGEISGNVIESHGKFRVLSSVLDSEGLDYADCVAIGDDRNNSSIFLKGIRKIGYNPDFVLRVKADYVVRDKLSSILSLINEKPVRRSLPLKTDLIREAIHVCGFFVPVLAILFGINAVGLLICTMIGIYSLSEWARLTRKNLPIISHITRLAAFQTEILSFAAAPIYFAVGILMTLLLFPLSISSGAIAIFALGDSMASIFGGLGSRKPLPFNKAKTWEGSLAGFFFAFIAGLFFLSPFLALIGAAVAMTIEYLPLPINDNILIPFLTGLALTIVSL